MHEVSAMSGRYGRVRPAKVPKERGTQQQLLVQRRQLSDGPSATDCCCRLSGAICGQGQAASSSSSPYRSWYVRTVEYPNTADTVQYPNPNPLPFLWCAIEQPAAEMGKIIVNENEAKKDALLLKWEQQGQSDSTGTSRAIFRAHTSPINNDAIFCSPDA